MDANLDSAPDQRRQERTIERRRLAMRWRIVEGQLAGRGARRQAARLAAGWGTAPAA